MSNPISNEPLEGSIGHHVHNPNEPLPGAKGAAPAVDYSPDTITHAKLPPTEVGDTQDLKPHHSGTHHQHVPHHYPGHTEPGVACDTATRTGEPSGTDDPSTAHNGVVTHAHNKSVNPFGTDDHPTAQTGFAPTHDDHSTTKKHGVDAKDLPTAPTGFAPTNDDHSTTKKHGLVANDHPTAAATNDDHSSAKKHGLDAKDHPTAQPTGFANTNDDYSATKKHGLHATNHSNNKPGIEDKIIGKTTEVSLQFSDLLSALSHTSLFL